MKKKIVMMYQKNISKKKYNLLKLLKQCGIILGFFFKSNRCFISLKGSVPFSVKFYFCSVLVTYRDLFFLCNQNPGTLYLIDTNFGVLSNIQCLRLKIGGVLFCKIL